MKDAGAVCLDIGGLGARYRGLSWVEIAAWIEGAQLAEIRPFWRREVIRLSAAAAAELNRATASDAKPPFQPD